METIRLTKPIPWQAPGGPKGVLVEMAPDRVRLELARGSERLSGRVEVAVMLPEHDEKFCLVGDVMNTLDSQVQDLVVEGADGHLFDLMGQVRKVQHIEICAHQNVEASDIYTGFSELSFVPEALPEFNFSNLDTSIEFLGRRFNAPILITGMTGGIERGAEINNRLALAAQEFGIPMGVGSQRVALENKAYCDIFDVKKTAPDIFLIGNIGGAQLLQGNPVDLCRQAVEMVGADALAIHLNVLQECLQVEGDRDFSGMLEAIGEVAADLGVPVMVKEVGCGISPATAAKLWQVGVHAIDVGGKGGTSWGYIEGLRSSSEETKELAQLFRDWGVPTAYTLAALKKAGAPGELVATGGIRDGLMIAKAVALGAKACGVGLPLMRAALKGEDEPKLVLKSLLRGLQVTMMASGASDLNQLSSKLCWGRPQASDFREYVNGFQS